jgi:hypothetical protein
MVDIGNGLRFKTSGIIPWRGYVEITVNALDLYDVKFFRIRANLTKVDNEVKDIYVDYLVNTIDEFVK